MISVRFIGGPLDGEFRVLETIQPVFEVPVYHRPDPEVVVGDPEKPITTRRAVYVRSVVYEYVETR